jgi:hypothetical protein
MKCLSCLVIALLMVSRLAPSAVRAADKTEPLLQAAEDYLAAHSVEIEQTAEETARVFVDGKPIAVPQTITHRSVIEIDAGRHLIRMTTKDDSGKELVILRKGKAVAMKIGSGPWTAPEGRYAHMGDMLANPFACPPPGSGENSPKWTMVGPERLDGVEATVIETVGDTAIKFAAERMRDGIAAIFPDAAARPKIEVLAYKSRHWIGAKDHRRLRVEQTSRHKMIMPGDSKAVIEASTKTTANYRRYDRVNIQVPDEAGRILDRGPK